MGNHRKTIGKLWERHGISVENQSVVPHQNNSKCWISSIKTIYICIFFQIYTYIYIITNIYIYMEMWEKRLYGQTTEMF